MQIRCTKADHRNQQIIGFCIDSTCSVQRPYCNSCLPFHGQHLNKLTSYELLSEWMQQRISRAQNVQKNVQMCKSALDSLLNFLIPFFSYNTYQFSEIGLSQIDFIIKSFCQMESCEALLFEQLNQSIEQTKSIINEFFKNLKNQTNQKEKSAVEIQNSDRKSLILEKSQRLSIYKANSNQSTFELMSQNSIKQDESCFAIAINKDSSIVLAGCNKDIKAYQHIEGNLNQIQLLREHKKVVFTLNFMKHTNNFVSGSLDNSIIIWHEIGYAQWSCNQKLNAHSHSIQCLLLNYTDDLIISGSSDKTIKFWIKQNQWSCYQTITEHSNKIYSLSLNEQQNQLISCSEDSQILIIGQYKQDKQWSVIQKIQVDQYGRRLCFINDNLFTFQPHCKEQMYVYGVDSNNKQYRKINEIIVKCGSNNCDGLFPQQYLKSKCLLVNKNGKNVNLMKRKKNSDFVIQQSIEFRSSNIYGQLSNDGEYLITWNSE